ncbi:hypothetical protein [Dactylosporangium sp. NPDC005555]|uniref:hypothetical protein n=1 Tax=Dactylosporangium sp. NPDC005555 TaxID=3154889 RepID=UPI00339F41E4
MKATSLAMRTGVVLAMVGVSALVAVQPASAHATIYSKSRSCGNYSGGVNSFDTMAWTQKDLGGSCAGDAWLKVTYTNGTSSGDLHTAGRAEAYGNIASAWHKSQSGESWVQSH